MTDKKKELGRLLMEDFPKNPDGVQQEMHSGMAQYLIIRDDICRCTACGKRFRADQIEHNDHRRMCHCPECGTYATVILSRYRFSGTIIEGEQHYVVFLSSPDTDYLYVSCFDCTVYFAQHSDTPIYDFLETQRYIFTENQAFRYGHDHYYEEVSYNRYNKRFYDDWTLRTRVTEPQFRTSPAYCREWYTMLNTGAIADICMRYCEMERYPGQSKIDYLSFYVRHKGAERLIKCGYAQQVYDCVTGSRYRLDINWKETELHKMFGVSRTAMKAIQNGEMKLNNVIDTARHFPYLSADRLTDYAKIIGSNYSMLEDVSAAAGQSVDRIVKYLIKKNYGLVEYHDYIRMSEALGADFTDKIVVFPPDPAKAHDSASERLALIEAEKKARQKPALVVSCQRLKKEREKLEFQYGELIAIQPQSMSDIIAEGNVQSICVGGYAERHAKGVLTIMFLRKISEPDKRFYTIEVSNDYRIVQCRGYANNVTSRGGKPKTPDIKEFEEKYQEYLDKLAADAAKEKKKSKKRCRKAAERTVA